MSKNVVELGLKAALEGGTRAAFKAVADGFKSLGKEIKTTSKALLDSGKTDAANTLGHLGMAVDRVSESYKGMAKSGKAVTAATKDATKVTKDYSDGLKVVSKAYAHWSNSGKGTAEQLQDASARTNMLSKSIERLGTTLKDGGASQKQVDAWKKSLNFDNIKAGFNANTFKESTNAFKSLNTEGLKLLGITEDIDKAAYKSGIARAQYSAQVRKAADISSRYTNAVKELGKAQGDNNSKVKEWAPALSKVNGAMDKVRATIGKATNMTNHWTRTTKYASLTQSVLAGNLQVTNNGFKILNEQGLKSFKGLTYEAADSMKMLSSRFNTLSVKTGAKSLTDYGKAVEAAKGQTDKFSKGLTTLAQKHGVSSAAFRSQYEDMKKADSMWNKHVTTLEKTGQVSAKTAKNMRDSFNAAGTSSVALAERLARPNKQYAEMEKTINRVSTATGKSVGEIKAQSAALKAQGLSHNKVVNALNASVGANRDYEKSQKAIRIQERELSKLRGQSVASIRKVTSAFLDSAKTEQQLASRSDIRIRNLKDQIVAEKNLIASKKRIQNATTSLTSKYADEIKINEKFARAVRATTEAYGKSSEAGKRMSASLKNLHTMWFKSAQGANLFSRALQSVGTHIKSFASYATAASFIAGIVGAFQQATVAVIEFDQALKDLQAITGATDREVELMGETIKQVASTTKFSATEVAAGMKTLGQAGLSAKEAIQTIQAVSDLATGTLSDMGTAVDLVTTAMRVFDIEATDSSRIADVFANAINKSKLTVDKLRIAFNYVGPIAARAGVQFEEVASSMMVLANSGVRASTIGTGLRQVFAKLVKPTDAFKKAVDAAGFSMEDFNLKNKPMREVIENLSIIVTDAGDAFKFFGLRGATAISALTQASTNGFDAMMEAVSKTGTAANMAGIQMEGLGVKIKNMWDKAKNLAIALGEMGLAGVLHVVVDAMRVLIQVFTEIAGNPIAGFILKLGAAVAVLLTLTVSTRALIATNLAGWFITAATGATGFSASMATATTAVRVFLVNLPVIGWVLISIGAALTAGVYAFEKWGNSAKDAYNESKNLAEEFEVLGTKISSYKEKIAGLDTSSKEFTNANLVLRGELSKVAKRLDEVGVLARQAELSIHALDGTFTDGGEAVDIYHEKLKSLEKINLLKAAENADKAFAQGLSVTSEAFDKLNGTVGTAYDTLKHFSMAHLKLLSADFSGAKEEWDSMGTGIKDSWKANVQLNEVVGRFENGTATFKELKTLLMDSKVASSNFGKTLLEDMQVVEESASGVITNLYKLGEINLSMSGDAILKVAKDLDLISDTTGPVAEAVKYLFSEMKRSSEDSVDGLAARWAKELQDTSKQFDVFYKKAIDGDDELVSEFYKNNKDVVKAFEERKRAIAESLVADRAEFSGVDDTEKKLLAEEKYKNESKKLLQEARKNETLHRHIQLQELDAWIKKENAKIESRFGGNEKYAADYYKESLRTLREYEKKRNEIMGATIDPKQAMTDFAKLKESEETALKTQLLEIQRQRALDQISEEQYQKKKVEITHNAYRQIAFEADWLYNKLKDQGANQEEIDKMYKKMQDALQKYKGVQNSTLESIKKDRDTNTKNLETQLKKQTKEHTTYATKIGKIHSTLATKLLNIRVKLSEKLTELIKKRAEVEKQASADKADIHEDTADKIRGIYQRDMSDEEKQYDNASWAQEKYARGMSTLNKAISTGDKNQLDRAKSLLQESSGLYENLEDSGKAVQGLRKIEDALTKATDAGSDIDKKVIDDDIRKEQNKAILKINQLKEVARIAIQAENTRHQNEIANLNKEIAKLREKAKIIETSSKQALYPGTTGAEVNQPNVVNENTNSMVSVPEGLPADIKQIGGEWIHVSEAVGKYSAEVTKAKTSTASMKGKADGTAKSLGIAAENAKNMEGGIDEWMKKMDSIILQLEDKLENTGEVKVEVNTDDVLTQWNEMDAFIESKPLSEHIELDPDTEWFGFISEKYTILREEILNNPLEVIVELNKTAYNKVISALEKLANMSIRPKVIPGMSTGGEVTGMYSGGRIGGINGFSSSRDTELVKARKGEWFIDNESGDYWGKDVMQGMLDPFSKMGREISSALSSPASMSRNNVSARSLQSSGGDDIFNSMQGFGTVNLNLPTAGPAIPLAMKQSDISVLLGQLKTMGKLAS